MRQIAVIDAETDPFKRGRIPRPFIWGLYTIDPVTGESLYKTFTTSAGMMRYLADKPWIVYAHNGGRFDFHFFLDWIPPLSDVMVIAGRLAKFQIGPTEFRDSFCILPVALSAYKKDEIDYTLFEAAVRNNPAAMKKIKAYLKTDCEYLYEIVQAFIDRYGPHLTLAGAAMSQWQKMTKRKAPRSSPFFHEELSAFYFGGRVQAFQTGVINRRFNVADINSAYPFAMLQQHPIGLDYETISHKPKQVIGSDFLRLRCISRGAFALRGEDGSLEFPCDSVERTYCATGWEYLAAVDTATIEKVKIVECIRFFELTDFGEYVRHFYDLRKAAKAAGDVAGDLLAKLMMNALYGKWGSDPSQYHKYIVVPQDEAAYLETVGYQDAGDLGPWTLGQRGLDEHEMRYFNVATAASITGYVRAMLLRALARSVDVLYCDTDSIAAGSPRVPYGAELGQWKDEGAFERAGIGGKKLYVFEGWRPTRTGRKRFSKIASKGARLTAAQLWKIAEGGQVKYNPENPTFSIKKGIFFQSRILKQTEKK